MFALVYLAATAHALSCEGGVKIQLAHVQDTTGTFADDLSIIKRDNLITQLLNDLADSYGSPVDYALASFGDKKAPITGFGPWGGFNTPDKWAGKAVDQCYTKHLNFSTDVSQAQTVFNGLVATGGKDYMENQWDALHRIARDSSLGWKPAFSLDENGLPVVKFALLITDDVAHRNSPTQDSLNRNLAYEYAAYGPGTSCPIGSTLAECGVNAWGTYAGMSNWNRSLFGSLSYWNAFYGYAEWNNEIRDKDMSTGVLGEEASKYRAFIDCCTYGASDIFNRCNNNARKYFPNSTACKAYGGSYATGSSPSDVPSEEFLRGMGHVDPTKVRPYDYNSQTITEADCSSMEYPDPFSAQYAAPFKNDVIFPLVIAAPPSKKLYNNGEAPRPTTDKLSYVNYDPLARHAAMVACPNMPHDPWDGYSCAVYGTNSYYSNSCSTYQPCTDLACQAKWWTDCMAKEYGGPIEAMWNNANVPGVVHNIDSDFNAEQLIESIKLIVDQALEQVVCPIIESSTEAPTTTQVPNNGLVTASRATTTVAVDNGLVTVDRTTTQAVDNGLVTVDRTTTHAVDNGLVTVEGTTTTQGFDNGLVTVPTSTRSLPVAVIMPTVAGSLPVESTSSSTSVVGVVTTAGVTPPITDATTTTDSGGNIGVVIGAAAGGVVAVGVGVIAALMAKGIIPGFGGRSAGEVGNDVAREELVAEREELAEVDEGMFN